MMVIKNNQTIIPAITNIFVSNTVKVTPSEEGDVYVTKYVGNLYQITYED